jgi:DNA polymerase-3 subunit epsilon
MAGLGALIGDDLRRWWYARRCADPALRSYYRVDTPTLDTPWTEAEFLAIDLETTGLDPARDVIVSVGWVPVIGGAVDLAGAAHHLVAADRSMPEESAVLHGILDDHLHDAPPLDEVLPLLFEALTGRLPIAHHAPVEVGFLGAACRRLYGCPLVVPFVDTLKLERRAFARAQTPAADGAFRLGAARERRGLPRYRGHDALADALGCAELFLAQAASLGGRRPARLDELL